VPKRHTTGWFQYCGDIELGGYFANEAGPVLLVLDLRIAHDRVGSSTDPNLNGHLKYPNNFDQSLNDAVANKVRKYRADSPLLPILPIQGRRCKNCPYQIELTL
jgi:hypothetical protein